MASELVEDAGELVGDIAASGYHDPLGQRVEQEYLVRADRMLDALYLGHDRRRARRDQDLVGRDLLAARQSDFVRTDDLGLLVGAGDVGIGERVGVSPLDPA